MHFISESQIQRIKDAIIGVNIKLGDIDYGIITEISVEVDNGNPTIYADTDTGFSFNAFQVYQMYRNLYENVPDKFFPDGSDYAKAQSSPKSKAKGGGGAVNAAAMPKYARIGEETIDISKRPG